MLHLKKPDCMTVFLLISFIKQALYISKKTAWTTAAKKGFLQNKNFSGFISELSVNIARTPSLPR